MNVLELSFKDIFKNVKKNYRLVFLSFLICIIVGLICGAINAYSYEPDNETQILEEQDSVDLDSIEKNGAYYYNAFLEIKEKRDYISAYLKYFESVDVSEKSRKSLEEVENKINEYKESYNNLKEFYFNNAPVIADDSEYAVKFLSQKVDYLEEKKTKNRNKIDEITDGGYTSEYKKEKEEQLFKNNSKLQNDIDILEHHIYIIENSSKREKNEISRIANGLFKENSEQLNSIVDDFNDAMYDVSKREGYEIVYNKRLIGDYFEDTGLNNAIDKESVLNQQLGKAVIYAKSIAGLDIKAERFFATLTFFILFGVIFSVIIGVVYKTSKEN